MREKNGTCNDCRAHTDRTGRGISIEEATRLAAIRTALADYMRSEGCSCCRNTEMHDKTTARLAGLLEVPMYDDGSGYDFNQFASDPVEV